MNLNTLILEMKSFALSKAFLIGFTLLGIVLCYAAFHQKSVLALKIQSQESHRATLALEKQEKAENLAAVERGELSFENMWYDPRGYYPWNRTWGFFPVHPYHFLATGQTDLYSPMHQISMFKKVNPTSLDVANPVPKLFGSLDPSFVLVFLLPLLVIGFGYGSISQDRETGTLPVLMVSLKNLNHLIWIKTFPRWFVFTFTVMLWASLACVIGGASPFDMPQKWLWLMAFLGAYTAFWFLLGVFINLKVKSLSTGTLVMAGIWALLSILIPAGSSTLARELYPIPSRITQANETREASKKAEKEAAKLLEQYYHDHPDLVQNESEDDALAGYFGYYRRSTSVNQAVNQATQETTMLFEQQKSGQHQVEFYLAHTSPVAMLSLALEELAGTSTGYMRAYEADLDQFTKQWRNFFTQKAFAGAVIQSEDLERFPQFKASLKQHEPKHDYFFAILMALNFVLMGMITLGASRQPIDEWF